MSASLVGSEMCIRDSLEGLAEDRGRLDLVRHACPGAARGAQRALPLRAGGPGGLGTRGVAGGQAGASLLGGPQ
eukprot:1402916-Alexandrium_andersonii.AAC.1